MYVYIYIYNINKMSYFGQFQRGSVGIHQKGGFQVLW